MSQIFISLLLFLGIGILGGIEAKSAPSFKRTVYLEDLDDPWDIAFSKNGTAFFTEKCKGLSVRKADGSLVFLFGKNEAALEAKDFFCQGQSGMHGVALDPKFEENRLLYVFMPSSLSQNPRTNRVVRLKVSADFRSVSERKDIVTDIAFKDKGNNWGGAGAHSGGRIAFGKDGYLFITTGDNHNGSLPQDLNRLGGKVLRVDREGKAAPGNKTPPGGDARIFAYGFRNPQGIDFHPRSGQPYISEHGPGHSDEVTALVAGGNGGWDPKPAQGVNCADNYCGYTANSPEGEPTSMTDLKKFPDALKPVMVNKDSQGMGPALFVKGKQWKSWEGALLVGILRGQRVEVLELNPEGQLKNKSVASLPEERIRELEQGPEGYIYVVTDGGEIWQLKPDGE